LPLNFTPIVGVHEELYIKLYRLLPERHPPIGSVTQLNQALVTRRRGHTCDFRRAGETDVSALERRAHDLLDAAYASGVRYFDAARGYGRAEDFLASWLDARGISPGDVALGSKWGYVYTADWCIGAESDEEKDLSVDNLRRQVAESRTILADHLALYQIHSATLEKWHA
jgi:aryl-alcohol dehydrogenase-like predicted oxidoreductase